MKLDIHRGWHDEVTDFCDHAVAAASQDDAERLVRRLHAICVAGPPSVCGHVGAGDLQREDLDRLLGAGAVESAALRMVKPCGYMLSCGEFGISIATIDFPAVGEVSFSGDSEAIALCGALATGLAQAFRQASDPPLR